MHKYVTIFLVLVTVIPEIAHCKDENSSVFSVQVRQVDGKMRFLSGFKLKGQHGIITALHGVTGRIKKITASNPVMDELYTDLSIIQIDRDHDLAIISSEEVDASPDDGFESDDKISLHNADHGRILGCPYGLNILSLKISFSNPSDIVLRELIPSDVWEAFQKRSSPDPQIKVLLVQSGLLPGESGAPILNDAGKIIAVGNGGLKSGSGGINWAIPFRDRIFKSPSDNALKELDRPEVLYAFYNTKPPTFPITMNRFDEDVYIGNKHKMTTQFSLGSDGHLETVTHYVTYDIDGFCCKVFYFFLDADTNVIFQERWQFHKCVNGIIQNNDTFPFSTTVPDSIMSNSQFVAIVQVEEKDGQPEIREVPRERILQALHKIRTQ